MANIVKQRGQGIVEYALLILLIAVVVVLALSAIGVELGTSYNEVTNSFP